MNLTLTRALTWIVVVFGGVILGFILFGNNSPHPYVVYARFSDASDLLPNGFVKIDGIEAGVVESVSLNKAESVAIVKMGLDPGSYPIGTGASAAVRPVNLLGEKYVQLTPGNTKDPLPSGSTIPLSRTSTPVELDDVFNTLDPTTRTALGMIINEAGIGLAGRGRDFAQTLADLPPTLSAASEVVGEVASENQALQTAITEGNADLQSVDGSKASLQNLIQAGDNALTSINTARTDLGRTVDTAPGGLSQLRTTVAQLGSAAVALTPASTALDQATPSLARTLERLPGFTTDATGALGEARSVAPMLTDLATRSTPILRQLRPAAASLSTFATTSQPLMNTLDQGTGLKYLFGFVNGWANVTSTKDALGHEFNLRLSLDDAAVKDILAQAGLTIPGDVRSRTAPVAHRTPAKTSAPASSPAGTPAPTSTPAPKSGGLAALGQGLKGIVGNAGATVGGVLHSTVGGVQKVLGVLTGGGSSGSTSTSGTPAPSSPGAATSRLLHYLLGS